MYNMSHTGFGLEVVCDTGSAIRVFTETYDGTPHAPTRLCALLASLQLMFNSLR